jgi:hypothetical protein
LRGRVQATAPRARTDASRYRTFESRDRAHAAILLTSAALTVMHSRDHRGRAPKQNTNRVPRVTLRSPGATLLCPYGALTRRLRASINYSFISTGFRNHAVSRDHLAVSSSIPNTPQRSNR